jgi:hypothetical protein
VISIVNNHPVHIENSRKLQGKIFSKSRQLTFDGKNHGNRK